MKKFMSALVAASFVLGLSTEEVDAKVRHHKHHNYMWHKGKHYHKRRKHKKVYHKGHASLPPAVVAHVHLASQRMSVAVNGQPYGEWVISSGGHGYITPQGSFHATRMARDYFSREYDNSPMPYSVFFYGGNAIHGTNHLRSLGHPASHGCVRLHPQFASQFFDLVQHYGMRRTQIIVSN